MAIDVQNARKSYGTRTERVLALDGLTFGVREGEILVVVGASGCGKSTLLKLIAGLIPLTSGKILLKGNPVHGPVKNIAMVFQTPVLLPWRNVISNIMLPAEMLHLEQKKCRSVANELIDLVGLRGFEYRYPYELSGGMQQRVSLCRALLTDPEFLLMDEPFGSLDAITRERMNLELLKIWEKNKKTVLFVTHSISEAVFLADRIIVTTPRPGRIRSIIEPNLPRPRDFSILKTEGFVKASSTIREQIEEEPGHKDASIGIDG